MPHRVNYFKHMTSEVQASLPPALTADGNFLMRSEASDHQHVPSPPHSNNPLNQFHFFRFDRKVRGQKASLGHLQETHAHVPVGSSFFFPGVGSALAFAPGVGSFLAPGTGSPFFFARLGGSGKGMVCLLAPTCKLILSLALTLPLRASKPCVSGV
jgi:hypothetical protein